MASPSVSYNFSNGSVSDADQVDSNFQDLINAMTDGTKSFSIDALTCAGTVTLNGAVTLGNATGDDITVTGYVASSIIPKTDATYALGGASNAWSALYVEGTTSLDGAVTINEAGADVDFRVESDTDTHLLFCDAGQSRVGIGDATVYAKLQVTSDYATVPNLVLWGPSSKDSGVDFYCNAGQRSGSIVTDGSTRFVIKGNTSTDIRIYANNSGNNGFEVLSGANCIRPLADDLIDLGDGSYKFDDIYATNTTIQTSDRNDKMDIVESDLGIEFINSLSPVSFKFKTGERTHYGLIAQDVEKVLPHDAAFLIKMKKEDDTIKYGLRYSELISPIIKSIQDLCKRIEKLETAS